MKTQIIEKMNQLYKDCLGNESVNKYAKVFKEYIYKRKAMFLPFVCVCTFMLVGYAAADKEAPVIESNTVELAYGEKLDSDMINVSDNRDSRTSLDVTIDKGNLDTNKVGMQTVAVTATDSFSNETVKTVTVNVVDVNAPELEAKDGNGYAIEVPVNASNDLANYLDASDDVDGDVSAFITSDQALNTKKLGSSTLDVTVEDDAGNATTKTYQFVVTDTIAPEVKLTKGKKVTVNYGSKFNIKNYIKATDNYDKSLDIETEGKVNTTKENDYKVKVTVSDDSGNETTKNLTFSIADTSAPALKLSRKTVEVKQYASFNPANYISSCIDNKDGNLRSKVKYNKISTDSTGTKTVTYTVSDKAGNTKTKSLTVKVVIARAGFVKAAQSKLGIPYRWGATGPNSFDCSGFTQWVYRQNGISIPRTSGAQKAAGKVVSISNLRVGDIVWRPGHVGIYVGGGRVIHAPHTGAVISYTSASGFTCGVRY